jgi:hypothetical protein
MFSFVLLDAESRKPVAVPPLVPQTQQVSTPASALPKHGAVCEVGILQGNMRLEPVAQRVE